MPKEYPLKNTEYRLPHNLYYRTLYIIRDYNRLKEDYENDIAYKPPVIDGAPKDKGAAKPTENTAIKLAGKHKELDAIEKALDMIPGEYRHGVLQSIIYRHPYPPYAARRTYGRQKHRVIYYTAKYLGYI